MSYVEPIKTLPKLPLAMTDWPLAQRILDAKDMTNYTTLEQQTAVTITMNEQPNRIPNNNIAGFMCFADRDGWGWRYWPPGRKPIGYALAREGATGSTGVFLAFKSAQDSLAMLLSKVRSRHIWQSCPNDWSLDIPATAKAYAEKWVAAPALFAQSVRGFTTQAEKVLAAWSD
jgi:hypothetical protein